MSNNKSNESTAIMAFLAGAVIAAGITLLLTPKTGKEVREKLGEAKDEALDKLKCCAKEAKFRMSPKTKGEALQYDGGDGWI
ncbi:YtxH domain-containing protein [Geotalea sp. SG265]|uniref:YtxH domain-containing protein n=1 Tax=Geotalea sp. SG265 TaxID=2922867 RepID=UPI001FAEBEAF|nr:YtxH domain-containing protein [Geotalea sp. SG265]